MVKKNTHTKNNQIRRWAKDMNRHFTQEGHMTIKYINSCSTSLAIRET